MNLTIVILDFGVRLYGGSKLSLDTVYGGSKTPLKMLATDAKNATKKIEPDPNFLLMDNNFGGSV